MKGSGHQVQMPEARRNISQMIDHKKQMEELEQFIAAAVHVEMLGAANTR